jgi:cyclic pyranopterin phosphate synthase
VNVSLDTLRRERFHRLTGVDGLPEVLRGIEASLEAGLSPVKINVVLLRDVNDDEWSALADLTIERPLNVRFIEYIRRSAAVGSTRLVGVPSDLVLASLAARYGRLEVPASAIPGGGPCEVWRIPGARGTVGLIRANGPTGCSRCNRLRLTCDGRLMSCLFAEESAPLREPLRRGDIETVRALFRRTVERKARGNSGGAAGRHVAMSAIGG